MIPASVIWILLPGIIAIILYVMKRWERLILIIGITTSLILAFLAWQLPIDEVISLRWWPGMPSFRINSQMIILGRAFIIDNSTRPMLMLIYVVISFWLGGAYSARVNRLFTPLGLGIAALLVASLSVRPNLYSALLLETVALISIPILAPPGESVARGVFRFLAFQTLGMCLILLGDWWIPIVVVSAVEATRALQAVALIGLGFALLSAIFPFHTWVLMLAEHAHPFPVTFLLFIFPSAVGLVALNYLDYFNQLSISALIYNAIRTFGVLVVLIAGIWAALQNHLGRILGFSVLTQIGLGLLVFSLRADTSFDPLYLGLYFALLLPQALSLGLWGLALQIIKNQVGSLQFENVRGIVQRFPIASGGLLVSNLSIAGLPLLASFPIYLILWATISEKYLTIALMMLVGSASLLIAALRSTAVLAKTDENISWVFSENRGQAILLILGCLALLFIGLMPQLILPPLINMAFIYSNPGP